MLRVLTGRNYLLNAALVRETGRALRETDRALIVVVPRQLTLETELSLLRGLNLQGSFRLRVLSPERLCALIFAAAGYPEGARIDERGRVMLLSKALKELRGELTLYRGAEARRGFVLRAAKQLEQFRQAGMTPEELSRSAESSRGALKLKLMDMSLILGAYADALAGRFQDGEAEFLLAAERCTDAAFLSEASLWFYGFDLMPPTMHALIAAISKYTDVNVLLPLDGDERARDYDLFRPLDQSMRRLVKDARAKNAAVVRENIEGPDPRAEELKHLGRELFCHPTHPFIEKPRHVQLFEARNPREEARFAAALVRRLARTRMWRFNDIRVLCPSMDAYREPLREAFAACKVPIFLSEGRPCSRHALIECLLTALKLISGGFRDDDLFAFLSTGYPDLSPDDADRLKNYTIGYGIRAGSFFRPFRRGPEALVSALEPLRRRAMEPVVRLRGALREAKDLRGQLTAVFQFLEDIGGWEKGMLRQKQLADGGLFELAGEEAQVWNRLLGALDQMDALLGGAKLRTAELADRLSESLDASVVKPLPQSGDAVYAQDLSRLSMLPAKAVLVLGQVDRAAGAPEGLLTDRQVEALSEAAGKYVGPTAADASRSRLFYIKAGVEMATDYVLVSFPLSGIDAAAERPGPVVQQLKQIFPALRARGGVGGDGRAEEVLYEAPGAALRQIAPALSEGALSAKHRRALAALAGIPDAREGLKKLSGALKLRSAVDRLNPDTANAIYRGLQRASVSRLESFAQCPFQHFIDYGLKPIVVEPYALTPRDEGVFFHDAVRSFLARAMDGEGFDPEVAEARMERVAEVLLSSMREGPLGQSAVSLAGERRLKDVARTAAKLIAEQLDGSRFRPVGLELRFGPEDGDAALLVGSGADCALYGSIDRVDEWEEDGKYLRILDYKRGSHAFDLAEAYLGLQLQLLVYLAAAAKKRGGLPAGAFYFRLDDGYVATQEVDPAAVDAKRHMDLRMEGLLPEDGRLLEALSPDCKRFFKKGFSADIDAIQRLARHALVMAGRHVDGIRSGEAAPSPARTKKTDACEWCDWKRACLFDEELDRGRVRRASAEPEQLAELLDGDR